MSLTIRQAAYALAGVAITALISAPVFAQQPAATASPAASQAGKRTLAEVLKRISEGAGVSVVADSTVSALMVTSPTEATTAANFEMQVATLVGELPKGATWAKLYLPATTGRGYTGDNVAEYALAQSKLFGRVGDAPAGTVEVMGQSLPADKADAVVASLNLKPVYLLTNPAARALLSKDGSPNWIAMTDEQKQAWSKQEAQRYLNMDPATRQQAMMQMWQQQGSIMGSMFQMMTPEQRQQMQQQMQQMGGMRGRGPGGGGRPGGQRP